MTKRIVTGRNAIVKGKNHTRKMQCKTTRMRIRTHTGASPLQFHTRSRVTAGIVIGIEEHLQVKVSQDLSENGSANETITGTPLLQGHQRRVAGIINRRSAIVTMKEGDTHGIVNVKESGIANVIVMTTIEKVNPRDRILHTALIIRLCPFTRTVTLT